MLFDTLTSSYMFCAAMVGTHEASSNSNEAHPLGLKRNSNGGSGGSGSGGAFMLTPSAQRSANRNAEPSAALKRP